MKTLQPRPVDELLRDFYRAEVPAPWPALTPPADVLPLPRRASRPSWLRKGIRLAVAASVALFLVGYLALASLFPREHPIGVPEGKHIGPLDGPRKRGDRIQSPSPAGDPQRGQSPSKLELIADPIPGGFIFTPGNRR